MHETTLFIICKQIRLVGGSTSDHLGTYMLMEDGDNPYVVHIPSHDFN